jgi:hypothetical protein
MAGEMVGWRDINSLALETEERKRAEEACRRVTWFYHQDSAVPCVDRGHLCMRCECIGRGDGEVRTLSTDAATRPALRPFQRPTRQRARDPNARGNPHPT